MDNKKLIINYLISQIRVMSLPAPEETIKKAIFKEGINTAIFYSDDFSILPIFKKLTALEKGVNLVLFSNIAYKKFKIIAREFGLNTDNFWTILLNSTGKGNAGAVFTYDELEDLTNYLNEMSGDIVILARSTPYLRSDLFDCLFMILDTLSEDKKVLSFIDLSSLTQEDIIKIAGLFDIAVKIENRESSFNARDVVYDLTVIRSIIREIRPGTISFKISEDMTTDYF